MAPDLFCVLGASKADFPQSFPQVFISHSYAFVFMQIVFIAYSFACILSEYLNLLRQYRIF